ncbi:MAG: hypothetical protein KGI08_05345 [Thaumarchaeota archaeon]|nr:hypothetical protein [Nitrososphaerota archaeon]
MVVAKLNARYDLTITDCYEHPEYLKIVLKEVYKEDYNSILDEIKLHLGDDLIAEKNMTDFFKIMES